MRKVLKDEEVLTELRRLQKSGRTSVRAGEIARRFSVDSVRALGAMERVKNRIEPPTAEEIIPPPTPAATVDGTIVEKQQLDELKREAARELFLASFTGAMAGVKTIAGAKKAAELARAGATAAFARIFHIEGAAKPKRKYTRRSRSGK